MTLSNKDTAYLLSTIRDIKDFPKKGIVFKDITTLLNTPKAFNLLMQHLKNRYKSYKLDYIAGIDSRGFIFGASLAQMLDIGFVPIRKKGKLPSKTYAQSYALEYGEDILEIHTDAFDNKKDAKVLMIDDLVATGGTANAGFDLIEKTGAVCVESCFLMSLEFLNGKKELEKKSKVYSILELN